jgi:spermidine synthase
VLLLLAAPRFSAVPAGGAMLALILLANWQFEHSASSHSHLRVGEFTFATQWNSDVAVVDSIPSRFGMLSVIDLNGPPHQELVPIRVLHIDDMPLCAALRDASDVETQSEWEVGSWTAREVSSRQSRPKVAIIGLGCGFTLAATLRGLPKDAEVTIIEINEQMPRMTEHFAEITKRPLADPRVTLTIADGFRYFLDRAKSAPPFDAVIVDITWMRDAALTHMFSQQFYQAVMNHITPDGVMAVWSESLAANEAQTAITFRTIQATWPEVVLRRIFGADIFLATRHRSLTASLNEHDWELLRSTRQLAAQVPLNTLDRLALSPVAFGSLKSDYSFSKFGSD